MVKKWDFGALLARRSRAYRQLLEIEADALPPDSGIAIRQA
jgi:hypothetical protein